MQLESHATPQQESPQQRYATLHRAIERGLDSDEVWNELAEVCLALGLDDEATRCVRRLQNPTLRLSLESRLQRRGWSADRPNSPSPHPQDRPAAGARAQRQQSKAHPAAPAASDAGPDERGTAAAERSDRFEIAGLSEHLVDAVQFLFQQQMPWIVLLTTLAFPLVVGVGGFLTAGGSPLLLAALAALPGLCVLAVVGAMGRRILVTSSEGSYDVPRLAELGPLVADAGRFLLDAAIVFGALLAPSLAALALDAPLATTLPGLLVGAFFAPLAWGLRQVRGDLGALSPVTLVRGVARCGAGYFGLAVLCAGSFLPAAFVAWAVGDRPLWVLLSLVGPLCVLPLFLTSRLLGTWLDSMRLELGAVLIGPQVRPTPSTQSRISEPAPDVCRPRFPPRPEALAHFEAPSAVVDQQKARRKTKPAVAPAPAAPAPAPAPAVPAPPEPRAIEGRSPRRPAVTDTPDLSSMPGAVVVSGADRVRQGAAARPR